MITKDITLAIKQLKNSEVVAIPTETVYGLAGNALEEKAIKKIFDLKNRPLNHPLIVHIARHQDLTLWVSHISEHARVLMEALWPGPLTLVFPCKKGVFSSLVTGNQSTIAIRCPAHPLSMSLLTQLEFPLVAPS